MLVLKTFPAIVTEEQHLGFFKDEKWTDFEHPKQMLMWHKQKCFEMLFKTALQIYIKFKNIKLNFKKQAQKKRKLL